MAYISQGPGARGGTGSRSVGLEAETQQGTQSAPGFEAGTPLGHQSMDGLSPHFTKLFVLPWQFGPIFLLADLLGGHSPLPFLRNLLASSRVSCHLLSPHLGGEAELCGMPSRGQMAGFLPIRSPSQDYLVLRFRLRTKVTRSGAPASSPSCSSARLLSQHDNIPRG